MYRLRRFFYQNKRKIISFALIVIFTLAIISTLNKAAIMQKEEDQKYTIIQDNSVSKTYNYVTDPSTTVISGKNVNKDNAKENGELIDNFINSCNNQELEEAYNMLSKECKELIYPTLESFIQKYYNTIFKTKKIYEKESWKTYNQRYTYRVVLTEDALSTGKLTYDNSFQDFYTIVNQDGQKKLNISSFVDREYINKTKQYEDIEIDVIYRDCYMDYEIYTLKVLNKTDKVILLDSKENTESTYLIGMTKYTSYSNEMEINYYEAQMENEEEEILELYDTEYNIGQNNQINQNLNSIENEKIEKESNNVKNIIIKEKTQKTVQIKFNKLYNPQRKVKALIFEDCITDYLEYRNYKNKKDYTNRIKIQIDL